MNRQISSNRFETRPCPRTTRRVLAAGFLVAAAWFPVAAAADGESALFQAGKSAFEEGKSAFEEGKTAFEAGDYGNAVAMYQQAKDAGYHVATVSYNIGVAEYRARNYAAAERAFVGASVDERLAPVSFYNLGLVAKRQGDLEGARVWFVQAKAHRGANQQLRSLATKAVARLPRTRVAIRPLLKPDEPKLSDYLRVSVHTGYATDSNAYRSPSASYVDLSDPTAPTIDPEVQSGSYVPVDAKADFRWGIHEDSHFTLNYRFRGKFYTDEELANADESTHEFTIGGVANTKTKRGKRYWSSRFVAARHDRIAYDRDDGQDLVSGTEDVTDRYNYNHFGPRVYYHREIGPVGFGFRLAAHINQYDETLDYLDLTHEQYLGGVHVSYRPWQRTTLKLTGDYYRRKYANRVHKDINGIRFTDNRLLEYEYLNYGLSVDQRLFRSLSLNFDYRFTQRNDRMDGYDDYDRHTGRVGMRFRAKLLTVEAAYTYRTYDFPNAFAFDNLLAGEKTLDTSYAMLEANYRFTRHFGVRLDLKNDLVESSDPRVEYDRMQVALSLRWRL